MSALEAAVYELIETQGPISIKEAAAEIVYNTRTVRNAVRTLIDSGLVIQTLSLEDARVKLYYVKTNI